MIDTPIQSSRRVGFRLPSGELAEPLFRNGHALILSTLLTSGLGFVFWILAARSYSPFIVGKDNAAISALSFLGGFAQLNLATVLIRFVPVAGSKRLRFITSTYAICAGVAIAFSVLFLAVIPHLVPTLSFIGRSWAYRAWWIVSTIMWSIFVLEDGAMTGLRKAGWVPIENAGFSIMKILLIIPFATLFPHTGIFIAWTLGTLLTVIPTNAFVFGRAIPQEQIRFPEGEVLVDQLVRYAPFDFLAQLFWLMATTLLPLLIIHRLGAKANAYFSFDWLIAYVLFLIAINLGSSLIVETASDKSQLAHQVRRVLIHLSKLLMPIVVLTILLAPVILDLFGSSYSSNGSGALRILAISALPNAIVAIAVCALRSQKKTRYIFVIDSAICAVVMTLSWFLLPVMGIDGAAMAWLFAMTAAAGVLLVTSGQWMGTDQGLIPRLSTLTDGAMSFVTRSRAIRLGQALKAGWLLRMSERFCDRTLPALLKGLEWSDRPIAEAVRGHQVRPSLSDTTVALLPNQDGTPFAVIKIARSQKSSADLERNLDAVNALLSDDRLADWKHYVPASSLHQVNGQLFSIESAIGGVSAERLLRQSAFLTDHIIERALDAIGDLHNATAIPYRVDALAFQYLAGRSLELLRAEMVGVPEWGCAMDRIQDELRARLWGKPVVLSRIHGDFSPGNVILELDSVQVTGILDWGQSRPLGLPAVDRLGFLFAVRCLQENKQFGHLVREALLQPDSSEQSTARRLEQILDESPFDRNDLLLLTWLDHIAGNLEKSDRYPNSRFWWSANVDSVLREFL